MRDIDTSIFYVKAYTIGAEIHLLFGDAKATHNGHCDGSVQVLPCSANRSRSM
jgi:hypothetical protein